MSLPNKGLPLYRPSSILPKEPQTALDNVTPSVEGDDTVSQSTRAYTYPASTSVAAPATLPPPPASSYQYSPISELQSSQQVLDLHLHQFLHLSCASQQPLSLHSSRPVNESSGYPGASRQPSGYQFDPGPRFTQDSQRTLVDTPRYSALRSTGDSLSSKSSTDEPGGQDFNEQRNTGQGTYGALGKHF